MNIKCIFKKLLFLIIFFTSIEYCELYSQSVNTISSPDSKIKITVTLNNQQLKYNVSKEGNEIVSLSPLGIKTSKEDFSNGLNQISSSTKSINESYSLPSGKKSVYINNYNELTIQLKKNSSDIQVVFRVYNDGIAYRYNIPGKGNISVYNETSAVAIANFDKSWGGKLANGSSEYYPARNWTESVALEKFAGPILIKNNKNSTWCLITEAANISNYTSSTFNTGDKTGLFNLVQVGEINSTLPLETPWRVVILGNLPTIVESVMIENLNPPTLLTDVSWIKPGRASWDWGAEEGHPAVSFALAKSYIDLASSMGWEYYMQDEGWDKLGFNLQLVIDYAKSKGIGILLWSNSNRFQNDENQIRSILSKWKSMGIKGVKVDFWKDDSQLEFEKYDKLVKIAAELKLLANLHGCTKPSGLRRTWPNLLTSEAVLGGEMYLFVPNSTPAYYNITLSMTRNVIGPMDYTPLDFANTNGGIKQNNTWSHQLALGTVYESGLQHMNDSPDNYKFHFAKEFLKALPVVWNETKCLEAYPDKYVTIARKHNKDWYIASLCDSARALNIKLTFLDDNVKYIAQIYKDGTCPSDIQFDQIEVKKDDILNVNMLTHGGATIRISTSPLEKPNFKLYEAEAINNTLTNSAQKVTDPDGLCSNNTFVGEIGNGSALIMNNITAATSGKFCMTVYYMTNDTRNTYIKINDQAEEVYSFNGWGGYNGKGLAMRTFIINLKSGANHIEFGNKDGYGINIDRIVISPSIDVPNVSITDIYAPISNENLNQEIVKVKINNEGKELKNVPISYTLNNGTPIIEIISTLPQQSAIDYTFSQKANLKQEKAYNLLVKINSEGDNNAYDDTLSINVSNYKVGSDWAIFCKGSGDAKVSVPNAADLESTASFTIEAWVNPIDFRGNVWEGSIVSKESEAGGYAINIGGDGKGRLVIFTNGKWIEATSDTKTITPGKWQHIAGVYDGSTIKFYVNGILKATQSVGSLPISTSYICIGASAAFRGREFHGGIDEVRIWKKALTEKEINDLKDFQLNGNEVGLTAYYRFNEGFGIVNIKDLTQNSHNASLVNMEALSSRTLGISLPVRKK